MKSVSFKSLLVFLLCLLIGITALYQKQIRATLHLTEHVVSVVDEKSALLKLLLMPEDFPNQFGWYWQRIGQSGSGATSMLGGYYGCYEVNIYQHVSESDKSFLRKIDGGAQFLGVPEALRDIHDLQEAGMADFQGTECLFNLDDTIICRMKIIDSDIAFEVEINYSERRNIDAMENILNSVIDVIVRKLQ